MTLKDAILKVKVLDRYELDKEYMRSIVKLENDLTVTLPSSLIHFEKKAVIPKLVADWIFKAQLVERFNLRTAIKNVTIYLYFKESKKVIEWLDNDGNQETFARAWLDGYTIEKEKRYRVKLKTLNDYLNETETGIHFYNDYTNNKTFTRKELEDAGFGWVFDCEGIEIEEVTE
jgi:hypothetical protein